MHWWVHAVPAGLEQGRRCEAGAVGSGWNGAQQASPARPSDGSGSGAPPCFAAPPPRSLTSRLPRPTRHLPPAPSQVLCPHPRAKKCTIEAARIVRDAAVAAGAPPGAYLQLPSCDVLAAASLPALLRCPSAVPGPLTASVLPPALHRTAHLADIVSWIEEPTLAVSQALMSSRDVSLILATGGPQMVRECVVHARAI